MENFDYLSIKELKSLCTYITGKNKAKKIATGRSFLEECTDCPFNHGERYACASIEKLTEEELISCTEKARKILSEKNKLAPCPFCGKTDSLFLGTIADIKESDDEISDDEWDKTHYSIVCNFKKGGCGASIGYYYNSTEEARDFWNNAKLRKSEEK